MDLVKICVIFGMKLQLQQISLHFFSFFPSTIPPPRIRIVNADPEKGRCVTRIGDYMEENVEKTAGSVDA